MKWKIFRLLKLSHLVGNIDAEKFRNWQNRVNKMMGNLLFHNKWMDLNREMNHCLLIVDNNIFLPAPDIWDADTCKN
jgi:hypothetical protein